MGVGRRCAGIDERFCASVDACDFASRPPSLPSPTTGEGTESLRVWCSMPVCEPTPARPRPMAGLSNSASAGSSCGVSGRAALARVGLAGSFFECLAGWRPFGALGRSGLLAISPIWAESGGWKSDAASRHSQFCRAHFRHAKSPSCPVSVMPSFRHGQFASGHDAPAGACVKTRAPPGARARPPAARRSNGRRDLATLGTRANSGNPQCGLPLSPS